MAKIRLPSINLHWKKYDSFLEAWKDEESLLPCIYCQADKEGKPLRIGRGRKGLRGRYFSSPDTINAAMHNSGNLVFVAIVDPKRLDKIEKQLLWNEHPQLNKRFPPHSEGLRLHHLGDCPI